MEKPKENQIVTISFFKYRSWHKFWAFSQMGRAPGKFKNQEGLQFIKMMGSGAGLGFSLKPDLTVYGLLAVWDNENFARQFFENSKTFQSMKSRSSYWWTVLMVPTKVKGYWDGVCPFQPVPPTERGEQQQQIAVITRASIHTRFIRRFWNQVPAVSRQLMLHKNQLIFTKGIGEVPVVQLATFSLWNDRKSMELFAYKNDPHKNLIRKTREEGWFNEELFAEFTAIGTLGHWE